MPTTSKKIRDDFDAIATIAHAESGRRVYDDFLLALIPKQATRILDVGSGFGTLCFGATAPGRMVFGLDLSPAMLARSARHAPQPGVHFVCGDFLELEFPADSFDCIVSAAALHHMPAEPAISKMIEMLREGGRLLIHDLRRDNSIWEAAYSVTAYAVEVIAALISPGRRRQSGEARRAWKKHGRGESYLTVAEARSLAARMLPGAHVHRHALWRYTIIWDKRPGGITSG